MKIRPATPEDGAFLLRMVAVAVDWRAGTVVRSAEQVLADPHLARYAAGWPHAGDHGVVAEDPEPVGAAWWRYFPEAAPGYGFVAADVPEVSVGVLAGRRGRGVGTLLLQALIAEARDLPGLSLSVEADNPAVRLYRRLGFAEVGTNGGAVTMLLPLRKG